MALDFGLDLTPHLFVDTTAAIGIAQRKGLGKVRHLDTQALWIQDALRQRREASQEEGFGPMTKHLVIGQALGPEKPREVPRQGGLDVL